MVYLYIISSIYTYFYIFTPICTYFYLYLPIFTTKVWYFTTVYHKSVVFYHKISSNFNIYWYIYTYFHQFIPISTYIYLDLLIFTSICTYFHDNSKCIRYLVSNYLDQWEVSILITWSILSNQRARNVPQNEVQTNYVPHVPQMRYTWGTKTSRPQDGKYLIFWKIWLPSFF